MYISFSCMYVYKIRQKREIYFLSLLLVRIENTINCWIHFDPVYLRGHHNSYLKYTGCPKMF